MKVILDTSIWIEFLKHNVHYYEHVQELLESLNVIGLSCIFGELLQGTRNNPERTIIKAYWDHISKVNEHDLWIKAGMLSSLNKLFSKGIGLIDSVIIVAAQENNAKIWSLDKKLLSVLHKKEIFEIGK